MSKRTQRMKKASLKPIKFRHEESFEPVRTSPGLRS